MSTPKDISNQLIRLFFTQEIAPGLTLIDAYETGEEINGASLVDSVGEFLEACQKEGIL